jgi:hypothetical protein
MQGPAGRNRVDQASPPAGPVGTKPAFLSGNFDTEHDMGGKASNFLQSDRPESGGADKDMQREKSGLLERDKERFAAEQQERQEQHREDEKREQGEK